MLNQGALISTPIIASSLGKHCVLESPHFTGWPLEHNAAESDLQWRESCCGFQSHAGSSEHNRQSVGSGGTCRLIKGNTAPMWSPNGPLQSPNSLTWSSSILANTRPPPVKIHIPGFPGLFLDSRISRARWPRPYAVLQDSDALALGPRSRHYML